MFSEDVVARFWSKVEKTDGCWVWTAGLFATGYGQFSVSSNGERKNWKAHRVAWSICFGHVPDLCVLHKCDNRPCVRPDHLFLGTRKDNAVDCSKKRRGFLQTDKHPLLRLQDSDINEIRRLDQQGLIAREIAEKFGISRSHVSNIVTGRHRIVSRVANGLTAPPRPVRTRGKRS